MVLIETVGLLLIGLVGLVFLGIGLLGFVLRRTFLGIPHLVWETIGLALALFFLGWRNGLQPWYLLSIGAITLVAALFDPFVFRLHHSIKKEELREVWIVSGVINLWAGLVMLGAYLLGAWLA